MKTFGYKTVRNGPTLKSRWSSTSDLVPLLFSPRAKRFRSFSSLQVQAISDRSPSCRLTQSGFLERGHWLSNCWTAEGAKSTIRRIWCLCSESARWLPSDDVSRATACEVDDPALLRHRSRRRSRWPVTPSHCGKPPVVDTAGTRARLPGSC